ncbi:hypothetical protein, partial [Winogradskyella sp.]|uniref:hypothetical protein n=1 Tax=Winogradskyella sp. TaxID=1883156 RepID=UPI0026013E4C
MLRDNREAVLRNILVQKGIRFEEANFIAKQFPTMKKTDRNWRLIQQQNEKLRGNSWQSRQKKSVEVAKEMVQDGV